jgi:hypothetical protein
MTWFKWGLLALLIILIVILVIWICCFRGRRGGSRRRGSSSSRGCDNSNERNNDRESWDGDNHNEERNRNRERGCERDEERAPCTRDNLVEKFEELEKRVCRNEGRTRYDFSQVVNQINGVANVQNTLLNRWSLNLGGTVGVPPSGTFNNVPMLFDAVSVQGGTITSDSQSNAASVQIAPAAGIIKALTIESSTLLTDGVVSITLNINGIPQLLTGTYNSTTPSTFLIVYPAAPIPFAAEDQIGTSLSASGALFTTFPVTYTAQVFVQYTPI